MTNVKVLGKWLGETPVRCELCGKRFERKFVDGKTNVGRWANMCMACHSHVGSGLGMARGQMYERFAGEWLKTAG